MDTPTRPKVLRRRLLIDKPTQYRLIGNLLLGFVLLCLANYVGITLSFGEGSPVQEMDAAFRDALLRAMVGFFLVVSVMLILLGVLLTHKFVGPAYVMRLAVEGMLQGDVKRRLTLRKADFLKPLAATLATFRERWVAREQDLATAHAEIARCAAAGDLAGLRTALAALPTALRPVLADAAPAGSPVAAPAPDASRTPVAV